MKKTVWIFDLDGTLVDSVGQIGYSINLARNDFGYEDLPSKKIMELVGLPIQNFLSDLSLDNCEIDSLISYFREILKREIERENIVFPGVELLLSKLHEDGHKLAIATSKPTYLAELVVRNSCLNEFIDLIQGTDGFPAKPDPTSLLMVMESLGAAGDAIMVGDRIEDILAARAAGIDSIGIANSFHGTQALKLAGAVHVFDSFLDFVNSKEIRNLLID
jgi:phosphoglycolate phosphatase